MKNSHFGNQSTESTVGQFMFMRFRKLLRCVFQFGKPKLQFANFEVDGLQQGIKCTFVSGRKYNCHLVTFIYIMMYTYIALTVIKQGTEPKDFSFSFTSALPHQYLPSPRLGIDNFPKIGYFFYWKKAVLVAMSWRG